MKFDHITIEIGSRVADVGLGEPVVELVVELDRECDQQL